MDLRKDYGKLYQQWLNEFQQKELTALSQDIFDDYKRIANYINDYEEEKYQNLVSSIKGYKKVKKYSIYREIEDISPEKIGIIEAGKEIRSVKPKVLSEDKITKISESAIKERKEDFNYTLIRILKKTPPLVGIDLINYGPFEKEDIANLPFGNAKILIYEKFAEKIDLS